MDIVDKAVPNAKRLSEPSSKNSAELLAAIEGILDTGHFQETRNHLEPFRKWKGAITWKTREDILEEMILSLANMPSMLPVDPTEEQRATERQQILNELTTRHRILFSLWPRDPRSKHIVKPASKNGIMGKSAMKGLELWGASLFDFHGKPTITGELTVSTSSRVLDFLKSVGEDYGESRQAVKRAEGEKDPRIIDPFDIAQLIQCEEREINAYMRARRTGKVEDMREEVKGKENGVVHKGGEEESKQKNSVDCEKGKEDERKKHEQDGMMEVDDEGEPMGYSGPYPIESLFSPSCYPKGWMREPFSGKDIFQGKPTDTPPSLQQYLPQRLLPKKLIVHDPCGVLRAPGCQQSVDKNCWTDMTDITHTFTLQISTQFTDQKCEEDAAAEKDELNMNSRLEKFLAKPHSKLERPPGYEMAIQEPTADGSVAMIYIVLPKVPHLQPAKEAHLYLAPAKDLGEGSHSHVYNAEFEVPRSLLVKEELCMDCVRADVEEQLKGRTTDLKNARRGKMSINKKDIRKPLLIFGGMFGGNDTVYVFDAGGCDTKTGYVGPYDVVIQTRVGYQNLERAPYCQHFRARDNAVHPLTAKVSVAAKLSFGHDSHLQTEAANYHRFPKHLFEHWSGFGLIRHPVPLGPVVPQFYGYYVPENEVASGSDRAYLSPILLVEKCGEPIKFRDLSIDDKQECTSLFYRFHKAGWTHCSAFERNILKQPGTLNASPNQRLGNSTKRGGYGVDWSFRLIDFGRSVYGPNGCPSTRADEEEKASWEIGDVSNPFW